MSRASFVLVLFGITLGTMSSAQTVTLVLQRDVSSKLPTGTTFTAKDSAGKIHHGHVVTHPAAISPEGHRPLVAFLYFLR
jgi:hypothetical protein